MLIIRGALSRCILGAFGASSGSLGEPLVVFGGLWWPLVAIGAPFVAFGVHWGASRGSLGCHWGSLGVFSGVIFLQHRRTIDFYSILFVDIFTIPNGREKEMLSKLNA